MDAGSSHPLESDRRRYGLGPARLDGRTVGAGVGRIPDRRAGGKGPAFRSRWPFRQPLGALWLCVTTIAKLPVHPRQQRLDLRWRNLEPDTCYSAAEDGVCGALTANPSPASSRPGRGWPDSCAGTTESTVIARFASSRPSSVTGDWTPPCWHSARPSTRPPAHVRPIAGPAPYGTGRVSTWCI